MSLPMQRRLARFAVCLSLCAGLFLPATDAVAQGGNAFAAAQTVTSPYGGSYSVDTGQWSGSSGTVAVTYSHFTLPNGWTYNGSWRYTGSVTSASILNGTLTGTWMIAGIDLGSGPMDLSFNMKVVFASGQATLTMIYTLPATVVSGTTVPATPQTTTLQLKQQDMVGFLL